MKHSLLLLGLLFSTLLSSAFAQTEADAEVIAVDAQAAVGWYYDANLGPYYNVGDGSGWVFLNAPGTWKFFHPDDGDPIGVYTYDYCFGEWVYTDESIFPWYFHFDVPAGVEPNPDTPGGIFIFHSPYDDLLTTSDEYFADSSTRAFSFEANVGSTTANAYLERKNGALVLMAKDQTGTVQQITLKGVTTPQSPDWFVPGWFGQTNLTDATNISGVPTRMIDAFYTGANVMINYGAAINHTDTLQWQYAYMIVRMLAIAEQATTDTGSMKYIIPHFIPHSANAPGDTQTDEVFYKGVIDKVMGVDSKYTKHILAWRVGNEQATLISEINTLAGELKTYLKATYPTASSLMVSSWGEGVQNPNGPIPNPKTQLPNIDIIGDNTFYGEFNGVGGGGGLRQSAGIIGNLGSNQAWAITEYYSYDIPGPVTQTIGSQTYTLELNSTLKGAEYLSNWNWIDTNLVGASKSTNLGGFVLNWAMPVFSGIQYYWKHSYIYPDAIPGGTTIDGRTTTTALRNETQYQVAKAYSGSESGEKSLLGTNLPPQIGTAGDSDPQGIFDANIVSSGSSWKWTQSASGTSVTAGQQITASINVTDPDGDTMTLKWYLVGGQGRNLTASQPAGDWSSNGFFNSASQELTVVSATDSGAKQTYVFNLPAGLPSGNVYQLRVIISDTNGNAATAAVPMLVK